MNFVSYENTPFGNSVEFVEKNEFGYNHRAISIHLDHANRVLGVNLYTFRYGRALWLRQDQNEVDWIQNNRESGKFIERANLKVFVSLIGGVGNPDEFYECIIKDLFPDITDIYLLNFLNEFRTSDRIDYPVFNLERYTSVSSPEERRRVGIRRKVQNFFHLRKRKSMRGVYF